jgi:hypothetical protein
MDAELCSTSRTYRICAYALVIAGMLFANLGQVIASECAMARKSASAARPQKGHER